MKSESIKNLTAALVKAQAEMPVVAMDKENPHMHYSYATLGAIINAVRPILAKYELSLVQFPVNEGDYIGVKSILSHTSGEWMEETVYVILEDKRPLSKAQSAGMTITYLRRYAISSLLCLYADEDTDAVTGELPVVQVKSKPKPEVRKPQPANSIQKLRAEFGGLYNKAVNELKLKDVPQISSKMSEQEILEKIADVTIRIKSEEDNYVPED